MRVHWNNADPQVYLSRLLYFILLTVFLLSLLLFSEELFFPRYLLFIYCFWLLFTMPQIDYSYFFPVTWLPLLLSNIPQILTSVIPHIKPLLNS